MAFRNYAPFRKTMDEPAFKKTSLYALIYEPLPALSRIEAELQAADPAVLSDLLMTESESVFILDYYFRLFDPKIAARIINAPEFSINAAVELYDCQVIRFYRNNLSSREYDFKHDSLSDTYWKYVETDRLLEMLQILIRGSEKLSPSVMLMLQNLDITRIFSATDTSRLKSRAMLELFKKIGSGILDVITNNLDLFDFIYSLASELKDSEYLTFLDEYTKFIVQIRIAQTMMEDGKTLLGKEGRIPFKDLVEMLSMIPDEALELTLEMMLQKHYIDANTIESIKQFRNEQIR